MPTPVLTYEMQRTAIRRALRAKGEGHGDGDALREGLLSLLTSRLVAEAEQFLQLNFPGIMQAWVHELVVAKATGELHLTDDELGDVLDGATVALHDWFGDRLTTTRQTIVEERDEFLGPPPD